MPGKIYRFLAILSIVSIVLVGAASPASATPWKDKVDTWVLQTASEGETEFLVFLTAQADLSAAKALSSKSDKGWYVYRTLTSLAKQTQPSLTAELDQLGVDYRPYWVVNMVWVRGSSNIVQAMAERNDVAYIYANPKVSMQLPDIQASTNLAPEGIEWNISWVNAPQVWNLGYTGQGVVVGGQDTGYQWDHPALISQYRGWDGASADHDYNWHDSIHDAIGNPCGSDSPEPCDDSGHGTHTMGTMVGDDAFSNQIGMAPGARWIGCRNMDDGVGTPTTYIECYQWFIAPTRLDGSDPNPDMAPDVINNSWGCPPGEGCTNPNVLLTAVQNLVAAGIVSTHSAGNSGNACSTVSDPAAIYDESFTVGATGDHSNMIAGFSSRGPVVVDGSNRSKPDISAPGVNIRSSVPGGFYQGGWSGTSMAGPHVAGLVALLISAQPAIRGQVDQIESIIERTALGRTTTQGCGGDLPDEIPNNTYGWGRIDALAAVQALHFIELEKAASAPAVMPGDLITYTLTITHESQTGPTTNILLADTIPVGTTFVSATSPYTQTDNIVQWGFPTLEAHQARSVELTVQVDISATGSITNNNYTVQSDQVAPVFGEPVMTSLEDLSLLNLEKFASSHVVFPGDLITYTINLSDIHPLISATQIVLTDTLPLGTSFISATEPYTQAGKVVRWDFPILDPSSTQTVELIVKVDFTTTGRVTNSDYAVRS
ncbi:MAG TPA: S8 family serine peptidase, partial [Anaerolineales bacterium]|nr:S8 family serine peptidase [Anaerolineales bacterium]